ncbi:MAG: DUF1080 domain-containing protein [Flavobacterium sp.]|nr:DUF1080 domain-containing protein [Flavobacterium sp.]
MKKHFFAACMATVIATSNLLAQGDPKATEVWLPVPKIVTPGKTFAHAPSDAIVLFDGTSLDKWVSTNDTTKPAEWIVKKGMVTVNKKAGNIQTKQSFTDYQLHLEWLIPKNITGQGQVRGNSGLFLASTGAGDLGYEVQVLDCYNNTTYVNGQTGSVYKQAIPLANACKQPGEWQTYDIIWTAPRFNADGSLQSAARVTVIHNGVLLQNNFELKGATTYIGAPSYKAHGASPIKLQSHGDPSEPISFRNIWVREL